MSGQEQGKMKDVVDVDYALAEVRRFGTFHYVQFFWIGLPIVFTALMNANYIFVAQDIEYRCIVPQCEISNTTDASVPDWWPTSTDHRCARPVLRPDLAGSVQQGCSKDMFLNVSESCTEWVYSSQDSIVAAFHMACKPWMRTLVGTTHNAGMLLSMPLLGYVSDRFGRKVSLIASAVGGGGLGVLKTFAPNYSTYLTFEFLEAALGAAAYTSTFVLLVEQGGKQRTTLSAAYVGFCITMGEIALALIAESFPYWKTMIWITYTPTLLFIFYYFLLSESMRWLLTNGKRDEAKKVIMRVAKWNKVQISKETIEYLDNIETVKTENSEKSTGINTRIKQIFSSPIILQRLAISSFWWLSAAFIYYGLMINSVGLPGNKYINFILTAAIAFPGDLLAMFTLNVFGRKRTLMILFVFCGACCIISGLVPESLWWLGVAVFLLGKMSIAACFNGIYIYTSELFPTSLRTSLVGCCSMFARVGSIVAPQTPLLVSIMPSLPSILFGGFALTAGFLMSFTPETLGHDLPDTMEQAERLGKGGVSADPAERLGKGGGSGDPAEQAERLSKGGGSGDPVPGICNAGFADN